MIFRFLFASFLALPVAASAFEYSTGFESPGFGIGPIHSQSGWSSRYTSGQGTAEVVESASALLIAPEGSQMLVLTRPDAESYPAAGVIINGGNAPLQNFTLEFQLAFQANSPFPYFQVQIGSAADSRSGVFTGFSIFDPDSKSASIKPFHGRGNRRVPLSIVEGNAASAAQPLSFYHFIVRVHGDGKLYSITVKQEESVVAAIANQPVEMVPNDYNRLIVSIPGGKADDRLFVDAIKVSE